MRGTGMSEYRPGRPLPSLGRQVTVRGKVVETAKKDPSEFARTLKKDERLARLEAAEAKVAAWRKTQN
jgi:hypothetical protein